MSFFTSLFTPAKRQVTKNAHPTDPSYLGGLEPGQPSFVDGGVPLKLTGSVPSWLSGSLYQLSPGAVSAAPNPTNPGVPASTHHYDGLPVTYRVEFLPESINVVYSNRGISRSAAVSSRRPSVFQGADGATSAAPAPAQVAQGGQQPTVPDFVTVELEDYRTRERLAKTAGNLTHPVQPEASRLSDFLDSVVIRTRTDKGGDAVMVALGHGLEVLLVEVDTLLTRRKISLLDQANLPFRTAGSQYVCIPQIRVDWHTRELFIVVVEYGRSASTIHAISITFEDLLQVNPSNVFSSPTPNALSPPGASPVPPATPTSSGSNAWRLLSTIPCIRPSPLLTFTLTQRFLVILEPPCTGVPPPVTPVAADADPALAPPPLSLTAFTSNIFWYDNEPTKVHVLSRTTGWLVRTYQAAGFFPLAIANAWEHVKSQASMTPTTTEEPNIDVVLDIESFDDSRIACDALTASILKSPEYNMLPTLMDKSTLRRYTLSDIHSVKTKPVTPATTTTSTTYDYVTSAATSMFAEQPITAGVEETALYDYPCDAFYVHLTNFPLIAATTNPRVLGLPAGVAYYYGLSHGGANPRRGSKGMVAGWYDRLMKVDVLTMTQLEWKADGCFPGKPVFVPEPNVGVDAAVSERRRPDRLGEHRGVVISVVLDASEKQSFLLVLDAVTWKELARCWLPEVVPFPYNATFDVL